MLYYTGITADAGTGRAVQITLGAPNDEAAIKTAEQLEVQEPLQLWLGGRSVAVVLPKALKARNAVAAKAARLVAQDTDRKPR